MTRAYELRLRRTRSATKGQLGPSQGCHQCLEDMKADLLLWATFYSSKDARSNATKARSSQAMTLAKLFSLFKHLKE